MIPALQVSIDRRSIYNHLYSGVYWEQNSVPLDDIVHLGAESTPLDVEGGSPAHQVQFRSQLDVGRKLTLDTGLASRNPLNPRHPEFTATDYVQPSEQGRAVQRKVT
jgi:hypothetical protein